MKISELTRRSADVYFIISFPLLFTDFHTTNTSIFLSTTMHVCLCVVSDT